MVTVFRLKKRLKTNQPMFKMGVSRNEAFSVEAAAQSGKNKVVCKKHNSLSLNLTNHI